MPELIVSTRELRYAGRTMLHGDRFDASDKDAKILKAIRKAEDVPARYGQPMGEVATTQLPLAAAPDPDPFEPPAVTPAPAPAPTPAAPEPPASKSEARPKSGPVKRPKYQTRDLRAED